MHTLSKSDYTLARTCDTKLYFRENRFPSASNPYLELLRNGGFMVDALARAQRPGGVLLETTHDPLQDFARTRELLECDTVTLFQATLVSGRRLARVDIIEKTGADVRLIEVKAKSFDSGDHEADIAKGGKGEFRSNKKPFAHIADWVLKFEDLTYQVLLFEKLFPHLTVHPVLMIVDKARRTSLDGAPKLFDLERRTHADGPEHTYSATFLGTAEDAAKLDILVPIDAAKDVAELRATVEVESSRLEALLDSAFDRSQVTLDAPKCKECQFHIDTDPTRNGFALCWGPMAGVTPHILDLYKVGTVTASDGVSLVESLTRAGKASLFDVPFDRLAKKDGSVGPQAERQRRQIEHTRTGQEWIGPALKAKVASPTYPMHFIDFEALRLAVPYHANMRPYGQVAFQWSVHTVDAPGATPRHAEWLNAADEWPNVTFAKLLREVIGDRDTVLTWSSFEKTTLRELAGEHSYFAAHDPALVAWVDDLNQKRMVDLWKWAENDYYHPGMGGSTSIKVVLDALWKTDSVLRDQFTAWTGRSASPADDPYLALPPLEIDGTAVNVHEGTGAVLAYEAMMYGVERRDADAKAKWRDLLLQYCELDTLSMVLIFEYWRRATGLA